MAKQDRVHNVQMDIAQRFDRIVNLCIAYGASDHYPDEYGREFYHAIVQLTHGTPLENLSLYFVDAASVGKYAMHSKKHRTSNKKNTKKCAE